MEGVESNVKSEIPQKTESDKKGRKEERKEGKEEIG